MDIINLLGCLRVKLSFPFIHINRDMRTVHPPQEIPQVDTDDIIKYKQSLFLRYRKLITKIDRGMLDTFIIPVSAMQSLAAESNLKELKMQYDLSLIHI